MGAVPAIPDDIEVRWRPLTDQERVTAAAYLSDAWELLLGRRPNLEADVTAGTVSTGNVIRVLVAMVKRVMLNPESKSEETIDDYRYKRDELVSSGILRVTDEELFDLTPAVSRARSRSVRLIAYGEV